MRPASIRLTAVVAALCLAVAACGSGDDTCSPATTATSDAGALQDAGASADATLGADATVVPVVNADAASTSTESAVRLANWSSDAPAVDFCLALHGTGAFQGPFVANLAAAAAVDASETALSFPSVSAYSLLKPGQYDARLVAAGAPDCSSGIIGDSTALTKVAAGQAETIALVGAAHPQTTSAGTQPGLRIVGLLDDTASSMVALRAINASPGLPVVVVGTQTAAFTPLFAPTSFGLPAPSVAPDASTPVVDANGYLTSVPLGDVTFAARGAGDSADSATSTQVSIGAGAVVTLVVVGTPSPSTNDGGVPVAQLVECVDNAGTTTAAGNCNVISE